MIAPIRARNHWMIAISVAAILLIGAVAVGLGSGGSGTAARPGQSRLTVAAASPTPSLEQSPSPSPSPLPSASSPPPADSLALIDSCDPTAVPTAAAVPTPSTGKDSSFVMRVPILMYHRIVPAADAGGSLPGLIVSPDRFSAQLDTLAAAGWRTITMADLAADLQARIQPAPKTFVITIDDGWDDGYTYALPILRAHGYAATYYVIAGRIDKSGFLSSVQIGALVAAGDEIGDHTMDHADLARTPVAKLGYEIDAAAARIAQVSGYWPESFAYPYRGVDDAAAVAVQGCGQLRTAVIEGLPRASSTASPTSSSSPLAGSTAAVAAPMRAAASPTSAQSPVCETWADRWAIPRLRVTPQTTPANLLGEVKRYS
jgi:peptidoglycan/xylan/chitin deacetylase (PgdA/CDA1 family)